jgi:hypothetical protein
MSESSSTLSWRSWPLVDSRRWSWLVPLAVLGVGAGVSYLGGGWLLALAVVAGLGVTLRHFVLPIDYEITSLGIRRRTMRRSRLVPWHAVRAYQLRPTGVVLYQRHDATKLDLLRSMFVPYPDEPDELLIAIRSQLSHAVEMPQ